MTESWPLKAIPLSGSAGFLTADPVRWAAKRMAWAGPDTCSDCGEHIPADGDSWGLCRACWEWEYGPSGL